MPLSPGALKKAEELEEALRARIESNPDADDYDAVSDKLATVGRLINDHYNAQRKTDENGRLTAEPPTRLPASVEGDPESEDTGYFYEPNITEVQNFLRRDPAALDRLGLRNWSTGISEPEKREPVLDPMSGAPQGWNVVPARTYLDNLQKTDSEYARAADEMYRLKSEEAKRYGTNLKRYRDVLFQPGQKVDYIRGGAGKVMDRAVAPALMGVADAATLGQATPLGDVLTELIDYEAGKRGIDIGPQPKGQDVVDRNKIAYVGGNMAGYGLPRNPANLIQGQLADVGNTLARQAIGKAANTAIPRAVVAAGSGAATNVLEGGLQDFSTRAARSGAGDPLGKDLKESAGAALDNMGMNAAMGGGLGGAMDLGASGVNALRQNYRSQPRNAPLRTLEAAGGGAHLGKGVTAPKDILRYYDESNQIGAHGTAGDRAAEAVAPDIERSLIDQADAEQARVERETQEYYRHPDYRDIEHSVKPAVQSLVDIAEGSFGRSSIDGSLIPADPPLMRKMGGVLNDYAQPVPVSKKDAASLAHTTGGIVMEGGIAKHLFGDEVAVGPDQVVLLRPIKVNAQGLTAMEGRIDRELGFSQTRNDPDDPVWNRFNLGIKQTRDQFPLYRDAEGNLVSPPPESVRPEPFPKDPGAVPPQDEMRVLNPPEPVRGGPQRKPEGLLGVGPGQPDLPSSPFDPRAGITPGVAADQLPRPIGIGGEGMVARPEGLFGVGPGGPSIPENPFDPRLPTSQEAIRPMMQQTITGGEYGPPPPIDPNARMGIGPRDNRGPVQSFTEEGLPLPAGKVSPQATQQVQGSYNRPPEVQMERAPITERNPYGFAARGQPEPEVPLPPSEKPPKTFRIMVVENGQPRPVAGMRAANSPEEAAAMVDTLNSYGTDEFIAEPIESMAPAPVKNQPPSSERRRTDKQPEFQVENANDLKKIPGALVVPKPLLKDQLSKLGIEPTLTPGQARERRIAQEERSARDQGFDSVEDYNEFWEANHATSDNPNRETIEGFIARKRAERGQVSPDERGGLERSLDEQLEQAPKVPTEEIEEIGALQTADREQVARDQKAYVEDIFSPGAEARAREVAKVEKLAQHQQAVEESMAQLNNIDRRLGPIPEEQKRKMLLDMISKKIGEEVTAEDLIRAGLIATGMVQMATGDEEGGAAVAGISFFGRGKRKGRREGVSGSPSVMDDLKGSARPSKPENLRVTTKDGKIREGFSALRSQQHDRLTAIEQAKARIGVGKDQSVEDRIRTFGQQGGRYGTDKTLLEEAKKIGKEKELRTAAGAAVYPHLKARAFFGGNEGLWKSTMDLVLMRGYKGAEYLAGRFDNDNMRNPFVQRAPEVSPFWKDPSTYAERIQQSLLEDPTRRLLDLSRGSPGARHGDDLRRIIEVLRGDGYYEENEQRSP